MAYNDNPLAIPEIRKRPKPIAPGSPGYDATVGPPAPVRPPAPANTGGAPTVGFNPTGQQLQDVGVLRPAASPTEVVPFSRDYPNPQKGGDGRLLPISRTIPGAAPAGGVGGGVTPTTLPQVLATNTPAAVNPAAAPGVPGVTAGVSTTDPVRFKGVGVVPTRIAGISEVTGNPDGSRTFTNDGAANATAASLASRGTLQRPGALAAEGANYLKTVPELGSGPTVTRPVAGGGGGGGGISPDLAARFAQSDAIAIANEDPRSALGSAARNARLRRDYVGPQTRTQREQSGEAYRQTLAALGGPGAAQIQTAADLQRTSAQEAGATERAAIGADAGIAQAQISRPRPQSQQVTLADGTIAQVGENGVSRPVTDASGKPIRALQQKDDANTKRTAALADELGKRALELIKQNTPVGEQPTPELITQARRQAAQLGGHQIATNPETGESLVNINGEWIPL